MHNWVRPLFLISFFVAFSVTFVDASHFYVNGTLYQTSNTPSIRLGHHVNITGRVILADPESACTSLKNPSSELVGNILWINPASASYSCDLPRRIKKAEEHGVVAVIYADNGFGAGSGSIAYYVNYNLNHISKSHIPAVAVTYSEHKDLINLLRKSNDITVNLLDGRNYMTEAGDSWTAYAIIMGGFSLICVLVSAHKLRLFIISSGFHADVPQGCLILNGIASLFRTLTAIDPPYVRGIYPVPFSAILESSNYVLTLCAALLLAFYWEEAMRVAQVHSIPTLQNMRVPFWISVTILAFLVVLSVVTRSLVILPGLVTYINLAIIIIYSIPITIFYSVQAGKVLYRLFRSSRVKMGKRQTVLYKMTLYLVGCAFFMFSYVVEILVLGSIPFTVTRYVILRFFMHGSINFVSLFQALAFQDPTGKNTSRTSEPGTRPTLPTIKSDEKIEMPSVDPE